MQSWRKMREMLARPDARRGARDMMAFAPGLAAWGLVPGKLRSACSVHQASVGAAMTEAWALWAVILPEIVMTQGHFAQTWQDARFPSVAAATLHYRWRPGVLGTMLAGLALYLPLRIFCGW